MKPFSEKALTEKAEKWEEKAFPEQGIDPDYAYDDVIEGFISGWRAREEDLRALLKERMTPHKEAMKYLKPDSCGYSIRANILHEYEELLAKLEKASPLANAREEEVGK